MTLSLAYDIYHQKAVKLDSYAIYGPLHLVSVR